MNARDDKKTKDESALQKLAPEVLLFIRTHELPLPVARKFLSFSKNEGAELVKLLESLILNQNKLSEVLDALNDISKKEDRRATEILQTCLEEAGANFDPPVRARRFRRILAGLRRPRLEKKKQEFEAVVGDLKLPPQARLDSSPFFEDDYVELKARLSSEKDIEALQEILQKREVWKKIFSLL